MAAKKPPLEVEEEYLDARPSLLARVGAYRKTLAALIGAGITWASACLGDGSGVSRAEWIALAVAAATALGVYASPNEPLEDDE